jgi:superfamily I DNA/RNA helicase
MRQEIENRREAWICFTLDVYDLEKAFKDKNISAALKVLEKHLDIKDIFEEFEEEKLKKLQLLINTWETIFTGDLDNLTLKDTAVLMNARFCNLENIGVIAPFKYPNKEDDDYFEPIYKHIDTLTYSCSKRIVLELFSENSNYMTIHQAKGKEFSSVLVNLEPFARGDEKNFTPTSVFTDPQIIGGDNLAYEEYIRIAYVGCSRAIDKLYIHIKGDKTTEQQIEKAIKSYYKDEPTKQDFFDFVMC